MGYTLSDVEQLVVDNVYPPDAADAEGSDGPDDQDPGDEHDDLAPLIVLPAPDSEANDDERAQISVVPDSDATGDSRESTDVADVTPLPAERDDAPSESA
jgi:hypothetical protein